MKDFGIDQKLCEFVKEFGDDLSSLEMLLFFGRHPNARFNRTAVIHALSSRRSDTGRTLKNLIDKNFVTTHAEYGIMLYALTRQEPTRSLIIEMVNIDQHQWQILLEPILQSQGIV
jgi:hypothetical protein